MTVSRRGNLSNALGSDLLISVPEATTRAAVADLGLVVLPLPLGLPSAPIYLSWHQSYDTDHAHAWLRGLTLTAPAMC